jgi:curved DNA-binding protein CbpA
MKDPYETLGVNRSATDKEIKDAFKRLARKFHPGLHPGHRIEPWRLLTGLRHCPVAGAAANP